MSNENNFKDGIRYNLMNTDEDMGLDIIAAFFAWAIKENKKCIYYVDKNRLDELEFFLLQYNLNFKELIESNQIILHSALEYYVEKRAFIRYSTLQNLVKDSLKEGYSGIAIVADRDCFFESGFDEEILYEYEKYLKTFLNEHPIAAISCYNIDRFGIDAFFAFNHLNPNFIYRIDDNIYIHNSQDMDGQSKETLSLVYDFLKVKENIVKENKIYQFISNLSGELSYKKSEMEIMETALNSICQATYMNLGIAAVSKDEVIDYDNLITYNTPIEISKAFSEYMRINGEDVLEKFKIINCMIFNYSDFDVTIRDYFDRYNIKSAIIMPVRYNNTLYGYICILSKNKYVNFTDNSKFLYKVCESVARMIAEYQKYKKIQDSLIQSRKMQALGELTGGIAHEFNNILMPILGYTQMLKNEVKDKKLLHYIDMIEYSAKDGSSIVRRIQEFTKSKRSEKEFVNVDKAIMQSVEIITPKWAFESQVNRRFINVKTNLKSNGFVQGAPTEFREIFINLMTNAVDAMSYGGEIDISSFNKDGDIIIIVKDNGIGMTQETMERIFEPFFTTKKDIGNGLGLSIVYNIIKQMKGDIEVESKLGQGTKFIMRFPLNRDSVLDDKSEYNTFDIISKNILIIDDQLPVAKTVSEMLKTLGHKAVYVTDEDKAVQIFSEQKFDCILCDLTMANTSGIKLSKLFKNLNSKVRFILMTGWPGKLKKDDLKHIDLIIEKPFSIEEVNKAVCNIT